MSGRKQVRAVVLAALLVLSTFSMVGVGAASASTGNDSTGNAMDSTFHVSQNGQCYSVSALGDGTQTVEQYYDYRKPSNSEKYNYTYSSHGTTDLQENQHSNIFVYHGSEGYSLVMVHDELDVNDQDAPHASTITFEFSNMGDGEWAVRDDNYTIDGNQQDDNWDIGGTDHVVDWMWAKHRTDGGAYRGIADEEITINPGFNDQASEWENWDYAGDDDNKTDAWMLLGSDSAQELSMTDSITVAQGECSDDTEPSTDPTAEFSVSDDTVANDESVAFDASNSTDDGEIVSYEWDFGDGNTATGETTSHSYDESGNYAVELTVTDDGGNSDTMTKTVRVEEPDDGSPVIQNFNFYTPTDDETVRVAFDGSSSITDIEVNVTDENDELVTTLTEDDFTSTDGGDIDSYEATTTVGGNGTYTATLLKAADDEGNDAADGQTARTYVGEVDGSIEYINKSAVEVNGEFERVWIRVEWYGNGGHATQKYTLENVSGTTTHSIPHGGMNGAAIYSASAEKHAGDGEADIHKENPYDYDIRPETVNLSVADVTETGDGVYDVTFAYENPNDDRMLAHESTFTSGNVDGDAPRRFYPGENTTTVTWTPAANDERVTLDVDLSNFDLDNESASTQSASEYGGAGDGDGDDGDDGNDSPTDGEPTAKLSLSTQTADFNDKIGLNASAATDDGEVVKYQWDFGNGVERTTPDDATGKHNPAHTIWHDIYKIYDEPGTYTVSVTVVDDDGHTDTATKKLTVEQNDDQEPKAKLNVPDEATVGEEVTFEATDFSEKKSHLSHICWVVGDDHDKPEGAIATHTFEETGEHTVELHLVDKSGNSNMLETTITVTKADDGSDDPSDDPKNDDPKNNDPKDDPPEDGLDDDPNEGNTGGSVPAADPPEDGSNDESNDGDETPKKAALDDTEGNYGEIVLQSDATDATVEVTESVPDDARQATVALDGFEALSYVTVSGTENLDATFTVSKDRLEAADASPEDVTLFHFESGSWNAVETEQLNETDDAFQFGANATNGTHAIGIGVPSTSVEDLSVTDYRVESGDEVTVTVTVANDGYASGTQDVALTVNGETVATKSVSVEADSTSEVEFTQSFDSPGVYAVSAGDANAELVVEGIETTESDDDSETATTTATETASTDETPGVPGFGVGAALVALAAAALLARRQA